MLTGVVAVLATTAVTVAVVATRSHPATPAGSGAGRAAPVPVTTASALTEARSFLDHWVDADGRVVRRDQGGDTVSEGQGYGMLLAVAVRDRARFTSIWTWTRDNLQRADGSLAWRWQNGTVQDTQPATDADLDVAQALLTAATVWHDPSLSGAAARICATTLRASTIATAPGRLLTAGPWATGTPTVPAEIDTGYLVAGEADALARETGQTGWRQVATGSQAMDRALLSGTQLPPDWATLSRGGPVGRPMVSALQAAPAPGTRTGSGSTVQYGLEAPRLLIRLADSCNTADRALAAGAPDAATVIGAPAIRTLDGSGQVTWQHPVTDVGAAAVFSARGDQQAARAALAAAAAQERQAPTYYGAAWTALGEIDLMTTRLGGCANEAQS